MKPDPIVHRDLTATNVLLTRDLRAKIANAGVSENLGLSAQILAVFNKSSNILSYMPPEVLTDSSPPKFGEKLDCFSFGHLALFLVNQEFPFCSHHHHSSVGADAQKKGVTELVKRKKHLDKMGKKHCLYKTVATCLNDFPQLRLSSQELVTELSNLCFVHPKSSSEMAKSCSFIKELWETFDSKAVENEIKRTSTPVFASSARAGSVDPPTSSASPAPKKDRRLSFRASSSNGSSYHEFKQVSALEKEIEDLKQVLERVRDELERETKKNEHHEKHSHSHRPRFGSRAELGDYEELLRKGLHEMTNLCKTKARELKELHEQNDGLVSAIEQLKQTELKHLIPQSVYDLVEEARKSMGGLDHTEANISLAKASANKTATKKNQITNASTSSNASSTAANEGKPLAINGKGGGTTNNTATNANSTKTVSASKESGESDTTPKRNESVGKGLWESIDMFGSEMQDALDKVMSLNKSGLS
jgi:serine/threonine protein kinase